MQDYRISEAIDYLNLVVGSDDPATEPKYINALSSLIKDGHTLYDFKLVIDKKWSDWQGTEWQKYMRPETLFGGNFKRYLNEQPRIAKTRISKLSDSVEKAKQFNWKMDSKRN
jgi:uncharacterized phage protein (TIGR02220 family)